MIKTNVENVCASIVYVKEIVDDRMIPLPQYVRRISY